MAVPAEIAGFLLVFYYENFPGPTDFRNFGIHFRAFYIWHADSGIFSIIHEQDFIKREFIPRLVFSFYFLNRNKASFGDLVLLPACLYNCEFHEFHTIRNFAK